VDALQTCRAAGIRVITVTGDHARTAVAVAREIGLGGGEIVAVTGDGVNDVPALQATDIGIAMGERGTRSAREVASIVLLDDNFRGIVRAISEGRQLFTNLQLSFQYLLMIHLPLVLTAALIPLAGFPLLYLPIHVVWLQQGSDVDHARSVALVVLTCASAGITAGLTGPAALIPSGPVAGEETSARGSPLPSRGRRCRRRAPARARCPTAGSERCAGPGRRRCPAGPPRSG